MKVIDMKPYHIGKICLFNGPILAKVVKVPTKDNQKSIIYLRPLINDYYDKGGDEDGTE